MRLKFNNIYDPGIGYEYETNINLSICPTSCTAMWIAEETLEFTISELDLKDAISFSIESENSKCALISLTETEKLKLISKIELQNGLKVSILLDKATINAGTT